MTDRSFEVPADRHYEGEHHLWAQPVAGRAGTVIRIGIDAIGLESLGELAYVDLKDVGTTVSRGESIGSLEAAKMTTNIVAPVGGTITERNDGVLQDPTRVNEDPYGAGWLVELEAPAWQTEALALVSGAAIPAWVATATARLDHESEAGAS